MFQSISIPVSAPFHYENDTLATGKFKPIDDSTQKNQWEQLWKGCQKAKSFGYTTDCELIPCESTNLNALKDKINGNSTGVILYS